MLSTYRSSGGRGRVQNMLLGQAPEPIRRPIQSYLELLKYWRDVAADRQSILRPDCIPQSDSAQSFPPAFVSPDRPWRVSIRITPLFASGYCAPAEGPRSTRMRSTALAGIISSGWRPAEFLESRLPVRE